MEFLSNEFSAGHDYPVAKWSENGQVYIRLESRSKPEMCVDVYCVGMRSVHSLHFH